jgi:hypothetical protein
LIEIPSRGFDKLAWPKEVVDANGTEPGVGYSGFTLAALRGGGAVAQVLAKAAKESGSLSLLTLSDNVLDAPAMTLLAAALIPDENNKSSNLTGLVMQRMQVRAHAPSSLRCVLSVSNGWSRARAGAGAGREALERGPDEKPCRRSKKHSHISCYYFPSQSSGLRRSWAATRRWWRR